MIFLHCYNIAMLMILTIKTAAAIQPPLWRGDELPPLEEQESDDDDDDDDARLLLIDDSSSNGDLPQ